ncbi:MAG: hypothetical protein ACD_40C00103G0007 [uncultured bacterium]|nr:MAG: hypothetical protein ACD_40C00103G0007 [uncultured bacterium]
MKNTNLILTVALTAVLMGGVGFWGGSKYTQNQRISRLAEMGGRTGGSPQNIRDVNSPSIGNRGNGIFVGEITAKDDKSVTVKSMDGSSKIVILADSTTYRVSSEVKADEVIVGKTISVLGIANSDGSTTATSIELNPVMRGQLPANN